MHPDLKPGNVMLTNRGVKLLDFRIHRLGPVTDEVMPTADRVRYAPCVDSVKSRLEETP